MSVLISFVIGVLLGGGIVWVFTQSKNKNASGESKSASAGAENLAEFNKTQDEKREESLQKIVNFAEQNSKVTNDDVQKLLNVSDATATRYLDEFEKQGKLKQVQEVGRGVYYKKP
jgi:predicted HTH transcriptional regulator